MTTTTTSTKSKKGTKKSTKTPEKVGTVLFTKVSRDHVDDALKRLGVKPRGSTAARVKQLTKKFAELNEKQDLFVCDPEEGGCGGEFTDDFELCPFCGMADPDDEDAEAEAGAEDGKSKKAEIVKPEPLPKGLAKFSDKDLDEDVSQIIELKKQTAICMWELGSAIKKNYDREFWKLRRDENGRQVYRNVKQFWAQELGFSHTYCYQLMEIADYFKKNDVKEVGTTKLALILRAPEKKRASLLKAAKGGASKSDIAKKVREINASDTTSSASAGEGKERKRRISVAVVPGRKTVKLYKKGKKGDEEVRATKMGDLPHGTMLFDNNTEMTIKLADKNGEWVAIVEFARIK